MTLSNVNVIQPKMLMKNEKSQKTSKAQEDAHEALSNHIFYEIMFTLWANLAKILEKR